MREIKFRAWSKQPMIMCYEFADGTAEINLGINENLRRYISDNNWVVMQYTGLKDKNGKEIYEGDVVKIPDDYEEYGFMAGEQREVYYLDGCFRLKPKKENTRDRGNTIADDMDKCEIIGNIYENPDLSTSK